MKIMNNKGLSILPCGTPVLTGSAFDKDPLKDTFCVLFVKYERNHLTVISVAPIVI